MMRKQLTEKGVKKELQKKGQQQGSKTIVKWYSYTKKGPFKFQCPLKKNKEEEQPKTNKKKKALKSNWDESSSKESE